MTSERRKINTRQASWQCNANKKNYYGRIVDALKAHRAQRERIERAQKIKLRTYTWYRIIAPLYSSPGGGGAEGDGDVPLDRVCFLRSSLLAQGI